MHTNYGLLGMGSGEELRGRVPQFLCSLTPHVFGPPQQVTTTRAIDIYLYIFIQMVGTEIEVHQKLEGMFYRKEFVSRLLLYLLQTCITCISHTHTHTH